MFFLYKVHSGELNNSILAVISLAIAGGFRPQTLVFLLPLTIYAFRKVGLKQFVVLGSLGLVICLIWFIPLVNSAGGITNYFTVLGAYSDRFQTTTSIFKGAGIFGLKRNFIKLALYTVYGLAATLISAVFLPSFLRRKPENSKDLYSFFLVWILPSGIYYFLVHMGQQGLVFTYLPALFLLLAAFVVNAFEEHGRKLLYAVIVMCVVNASVFLFVPEYPFPGIDQRLLTRDTLRNSDDYFQQRFDVIRYNFLPESSLIFATNWHHVEYYLPEYQVIRFDIGAKWEVNEGDIDTGDTLIIKTDENAQLEMTRVIIFDDELNQINLSLDQLKQFAISENQFIQYFEVGKDDTLEVGNSFISLIKN